MARGEPTTLPPMHVGAVNCNRQSYERRPAVLPQNQVGLRAGAAVPRANGAAAVTMRVRRRGSGHHARANRPGRELRLRTWKRDAREREDERLGKATC